MAPSRVQSLKLSKKKKDHCLLFADIKDIIEDIKS